MANVRKIRRAVLGALIGIAGLNIFTACYGMPPESYSDTRVIYGTVTDESGNPINGIQVSLDGERFATTDEVGVFSNFVASDKSVFEVGFKDIDGEKNGGLFEEKTVSVTVIGGDREPVAVTLHKVK